MIFYLSFTRRQLWLGGAFVEAANAMSALWDAAKLGLNPGGSVKLLTVPLAFEPLARQHLNRRLAESDIKTLFPEDV